MRRLVALSLAVGLHAAGGAPQTAAAPASAPASAPALRRGAAGVVRTVLEGTRLEELPVTFLGTFPNFAGPGLDLHLVRLEGETAAEVGVAAGMSGSPVYVEGTLIGALSYRIGALPKSAIAGVTPLADVLATARHGAGAAAHPADPALSRLATPVAAGGLAAEVRQWAGPMFEALGLRLVGGGTAAEKAAEPAAPLVPGSPVGVELVRGDARLAATGTVTWVDGDAVWAFGHPFFGAGPVELPMAAAEVIQTVPDLAGSFKLATVGASIGAVLDDRPSAIFGRLGARARMIPVGLEVRGGAYGTVTRRYEVARSSDLTPLLSGVVVANSLIVNNGYSRQSTLHARGAVRLRGLPPVPLEMTYSSAQGREPAVAIAGSLFETLTWLWRNPFEELQVEGIDLAVDARSEPLHYTIRDLNYDRGRLTPGEPLCVRLRLGRFRGPDVVREFRLDLPEHVTAGDGLTLVVGNPEAVDRALGRTFDLQVRSAADARSLVGALSAPRAAHRLVAQVVVPGAAVVSGGVAWGTLPPTAERLLAQRPDAAVRSAGPLAPLARAEIELDGPVDGLAQVRLRIRRAS